MLMCKSWLCTLELLLAKLRGTLWDAGDQTQVVHMQGKLATHYAMALAPG